MTSPSSPSRTAERRVSARASAVDAAMVDDDRGAAEGFADGVGRPAVCRHVLVAALRSDERAVERVDDDQHRRAVVADLLAHGGDERFVVGDEIEPIGDQMKRRGGDVMLTAIGFDASARARDRRRCLA
jgi:hypothetical protein